MVGALGLCVSATTAMTATTMTASAATARISTRRLRLGRSQVGVRTLARLVVLEHGGSVRPTSTVGRRIEPCEAGDLGYVLQASLVRRTART